MTQPKIEEHPDEGKQLTAAKWREAFLIAWRDLPPTSRGINKAMLLDSAVRLSTPTMAKATGKLAGKNDPYTERQLALALGRAPMTARRILRWFEVEGWLLVEKTHSRRAADIRSLVIPAGAVIAPPGWPLVEVDGQPPRSDASHHVDGQGSRSDASHHAGDATAGLMAKTPQFDGQNQEVDGQPQDQTLATPSVTLGSLGVNTTKELVLTTGRDGDGNVLEQVAQVNQVTTAGEEDGNSPLSPATVVEPTPPHQGVPEVGPKLSSRTRFYRRRVRTHLDGDGAVFAVYGNEIVVKLDSNGDTRRYYAEDLELLPEVES